MTGWFMSGLRLAAAVLLPAAAWAEADVATVETISAGQRDKVLAIFNQQQRNFAEDCKAVRIVKATALSVAEPVVTNTGGKPMSGRWRVRYSVDACGKIGLRMVEMTVAGPGIAIDPLAPGETLVDARLQRDVVRSFGMAGRVAMPNCTDDAVIRDTSVRVYPATTDDKWQELWIGRMCGRDLGQVVEFMPTKGGTTFKMSLPVAGKK